MPLLKLCSPVAATFAAPRPRGFKFATVAALALLALPAVAGCSKNSSSSSASQPEAANPNDPVIARVNGTAIRGSDIQMAEEDVGADLQGPPDHKREQLIAYLTDVILVSQAAEKKNMAENADFKRRQAFMRNKLLMGTMLQSHAKAAATDEEMRKVYDEAVKPMAAEEEVRARHILVETEDEAKAILTEINAGGDFAELAKTKSKDPGAADGGDLGYFTKGQMVPEFSEVAFKMYAGQVSNPVKSQFGWHIIKVEDKRNRQPPDYDKVKDQIETFVARRAQTEFVAQLREQAKIERLDKPAGASATPPGVPPEVLRRMQEQQQQQQQPSPAEAPKAEAPQ
ncbi:MAG: peptidyl-prolyl cis-trans isomerase [Alphaproteobacteria bacterium]|nr:peptidyl-prolyl cis-trans isomerase [Alphaproteobacteria bacterium]